MPPISSQNLIFGEKRGGDGKVIIEDTDKDILTCDSSKNEPICGPYIRNVNLEVSDSNRGTDEQTTYRCGDKKVIIEGTLYSDGPTEISTALAQPMQGPSLFSGEAEGTSTNIGLASKSYSDTQDYSASRGVDDFEMSKSMKNDL